MFNVATQQHFAKTEKVAAVEGGSEATEIVEVSSSGYNLGFRKITRFSPVIFYHKHAYHIKGIWELS